MREKELDFSELEKLNFSDEMKTDKKRTTEAPKKVKQEKPIEDSKVKQIPKPKKERPVRIDYKDDVYIEYLHEIVSKELKKMKMFGIIIDHLDPRNDINVDGISINEALFNTHKMMLTQIEKNIKEAFDLVEKKIGKIRFERAAHGNKLHDKGRFLSVKLVKTDKS